MLDSDNREEKKMNNILYYFVVVAVPVCGLIGICFIGRAFTHLYQKQSGSTMLFVAGLSAIMSSFLLLLHATNALISLYSAHVIH